MERELKVGSEDEVELQGPEDEAEDEAEAKVGPTEKADGPSRAEKRRNRFAENLEARQRTEFENRDLRERLDRLERSQQSPPPAQGQRDVMGQRSEENYRKRVELAERYNRLAEAGKATKQDFADYQRDSRVLEDEGIDLRIAQGVAAYTRHQESQRNPAREHLEARYPDVMGNESAKAMAMSEFLRRQARGEKESPAMRDECMEFAQREILGVGHAVTAADRQRLTGAPSGASTGAGAKTLKMTPEYKQIAESWAKHNGHGDKPEREQWSKWANGPGRDISG
jgi:hypothetical protein